MILASKSPRRKEILENIGIEVIVVIPDIEEISSKEGVAEKIKDIALKKCEKIAEIYPNNYVTAADTVVVYGEEILGKPANEQEAREMLMKLSGKEHSVITAFAFINKAEKLEISLSDITTVKFREISAEELDWYIKSGEPFDKAGAYGIQGKGAVFVEKINGDFFNVMGFPIQKFITEIKRATGKGFNEILKM